MERQSFVTREELQILEDTISELSATQSQHSEKISRLEKRSEDMTRHRGVWGPSSPFSGIHGPQQESSFNPAAEAFRNFDTDPSTGLIGPLSLDNSDDPRRIGTSRANSVRFDESANNHYGSSRQSLELPMRTGSGLGSHPLSERSLSHRSEGRGSTSGFRTNSFGLEQSRLLGSIHNSPRVSGNPPPGFFLLGPCPSIIRCWLSDTFSNDSLLYAAVCTGSSSSAIGLPLVQKLGLSNTVFEEGGVSKIKLQVYLTEAKIQYPSSRSTSPSPQVPTLIVKFTIDETSAQDKSIQVILGSDVLRSHSADILFSQDKLMIFDEERNQLSIPLVRPEDDALYRYLGTVARSRNNGVVTSILQQNINANDNGVPGVIGQPGKSIAAAASESESPTVQSPAVNTSVMPSDQGNSKTSDPAIDAPSRSSTDLGQSQANEDAKSTTGSEASFTATNSKPASGVWAASWRPATQADAPSTAKPSATYARPGTSRPMKVLRPGKSMSSVTRTVSSPITNTPENVSPYQEDQERRPSETGSGERKSSTATPTKANPIGSGSAFGWLNQSQQRRTTANGNQ